MIENAEEIFEVYPPPPLPLNLMIPVLIPLAQVPAEVQVVADRYLKKLNRKRDRMSASVSSRDSIDGIVGSSEVHRLEEEDLVIDQYSTSCKRQCAEGFHESGKEQATDELAKLYEFVKNMPDGPQKNHFLKKVGRLSDVCMCTTTNFESVCVCVHTLV